jgi:hypothetical protein
MLTALDQNTIANMTAALEHVCKKIPAEKDTHELRKRVADAIIACALNEKQTFIDFQNAGLSALDEITSPFKAGSFSRLFRFVSGVRKLFV